MLTMVVTFTAGNQFSVSSTASILLDSFRDYANANNGLGNIPRDNIMLLT